MQSPKVLTFMEAVAATTTARNSNFQNHQLTEGPTEETENIAVKEPAAVRKTHFLNLLVHGEPGRPSIRLRSVRFFMDDNSERIGVAFCSALAKNAVFISPGLGRLLNDSADSATMKRKFYNELP